MTPAPQPDWSVIRADYEDGPDTVPAVCVRHGVTEAQLYARARAEGWKRRSQRAPGAAAVKRTTARPTATARTRLIGQIYRTLTTNLKLMEDRMTQDDTRSAADQSRDTRALTSLIQRLDKVKELESDATLPGGGAPKSGPAHTLTFEEEELLRLELAERILKLRERKIP